MIRIREIIRLSNMGLSQRSIASSLQCSRNTVSDVLVRAGQKDIIWPLPDDVTDAQLLHILFPERAQQSPYARPIPDCEWIHRELAKSGVTLSLLWTEYCEQCRNHQQIPLMYSQFCNYYRNYARTQKVSMHIQRKPGDQMEVDWAGQTAVVVDRETGELFQYRSLLLYYPVASTPTSKGFCPKTKKTGLPHTSMHSRIIVAFPKSLCPTT